MLHEVLEEYGEENQRVYPVHACAAGIKVGSGEGGFRRFELPLHIE